MRKAPVKARRETKRERRGKNSARGGAVGFDNPTDAVAEIGMARKSERDTTPLEARTPNQSRYLDSLQSKELVFATGEAGCGKTFIAATWAADRLLAKDFSKIIVTRPVLQADEDLGFLPGTVEEKFAPYFRPVYDILAKRLGYSFLQYCLRPEIGKVEIAPFAYMRGRTFSDAVVILDEAQNVTVKQMKMFLTRLGENCVVIVNGDAGQIDLPSESLSGLKDALSRFEDDELVSVIRFDKNDSVRSPLCSRVLNAYN